MKKLSAVIITYNEEKNIKRCILSLQGIADEIIVVDSFSTDRTEEICRKLNVRFLKNEFLGYGNQKQYAAKQAIFDWILSIDADEELSEELKQSILLEKKKYTLADAYSFNRRNFYCGKKIRYCGWYPDKQIRLYEKSKLAWADNLVHEKLEITDAIRLIHLKGDLYHYTYENEEQHEQKACKYALLASEELAQKQKKISYFNTILKTAFRFIRTYFLQLGFLDGYYGFKISLMSAKFVYWKYNRLK